MPIDLPPHPTVLFQGDSITRAGRHPASPSDLGHGYAALAAPALREAHPGATVLNRGVSGDGVTDLRGRWADDALAHRPDLLSLLIGVNDTWRWQEGGIESPIDPWEGHYRALLDELLDRHSTARLVLVEPFLLPVAPAQWAWRPDLDARIQVVRRLAEEYGALLLAADGLLNQAARTLGGPAAIAADGIHPTPAGHRLLAEAWTALVLG
ncbi:SGNH/GDSL hydrolase family protein [Kitasatospora albolonga]|uniref:SGNH/GDSL hydrolase family protein n=1 Tax=Kitasatospora albolonga TaxID=68173 RepID=UPI0031EF19E5